MGQEITYSQVLDYFKEEPVFVTGFCSLYNINRHYLCLYRPKHSVKCLYLNKGTNLSAYELFSLLSDNMVNDLSKIDFNDKPEFTVKEQVTGEFITKWCYGLRKINDDVLPQREKDILSLFNRLELIDLYLDEDGILKVILRNHDKKLVDIIQNHFGKIDLSFGNSYGMWEYVEKTTDKSTLLYPLYTRNPYYFGEFFIEETINHYHIFIVSGFHYPEFLNDFQKLKKDSRYLGPSVFLLSSISDYISMIEFLCSLSCLESKKAFFKTCRYTDEICIEIMPLDGPLGHTGLKYKSWQTSLSRIANGCIVGKWQNEASIFTHVKMKIEPLHVFCNELIQINQLNVKIQNIHSFSAAAVEEIN